MTENEMVAPDFRKPNEVDQLAETIRAAIDQFVWRTGLKPEWVGFAYGDETTVSILFNQYDHQGRGPYFMNGMEPGPGGEMPPDSEPSDA